MSFTSCPTEILCSIFLGIPDAVSILACRAVCKAFLEVVDSSVELQYQIKLDVWEYEDNPEISYQAMSISERLGQLERHVAAWDALDWEETRIHLPPDCHHFAFTNGTFFGLMHDYDPEDGPELCLISVKLPSRILGTPPSVSRAIFHGIGAVMQFRIDASQDLLVIAEL